MARTKQTSTRNEHHMLHVIEAVDHQGEPMVRVRYSLPAETIPPDFRQTPVFTFQVYSTIPLDLYEEEQPAKYASIPGRSARINLDNVIEFLALQLGSDSQRPDPVFEIYSQQAEVFACVEHQRREIAHRKAGRDDSATLLIPRVAVSMYDSRRSGFIFVITSNSFKEGYMRPERGFDPNGPLYVHFDRAFPSVTSLHWTERLQDDPILAQQVGMEADEIGVFPEKLDVRVERVQKTAEKRVELAQIYRNSYSPNDRMGQFDFALDLDESSPDDDDNHVFTTATIEALRQIADGFHSENLRIEETDSSRVTISNHAEDAEIELCYLISVSFMHRGDTELTLRDVAKAFTSVVTSRLANPHATFSFEFFQPSTPALAIVLESARSILADKPVDFIGARINTSTIPRFSSTKDTQPTEEIHQRLHPIHRSDSLALNLPSNCSWEPYRTFVILLDRPDFMTVPGGVRFLLADGGKIKTRPEEAEWNPVFQGAAQDFVEMQVWRSAGVEEVTRRLEMRDPTLHQSVEVE